MKFKYKVDKNAPRFDLKIRPVTSERALLVRLSEISELLESATALVAKPLDTEEYYFEKRE